MRTGRLLQVAGSSPGGAPPGRGRRRLRDVVLPAAVLACPLVLGTPLPATAADVAPPAPVVDPERFEGDYVDRSSAAVGAVVGLLSGLGLAGIAISRTAVRRERRYRELEDQHLGRVERLLTRQESLFDQLDAERRAGFLVASRAPSPDGPRAGRHAGPQGAPADGEPYQRAGADGEPV